MMRIRLFDSDRWEEVLLTLQTNKLRSVLTAFGIFWGIFMLLLLTGGSRGLQTLLETTFTGFATNTYFVMPEKTSLPYKGFRVGRKWDLEVADMERLRHQIAELEVVTPVFGLWGVPAIAENRQFNCHVKGVDADYERVENPNMAWGRYLNNDDVRRCRKVCVIGRRMSEELFPGIANPCGRWVRVRGVYYQVIGVSYRSGMSVMGNAETCMQIPYTTMQQVYGLGKNVQAIAMTLKNGYSVTAVAPRIDALIKRVHSIHPEDKQALFGLNMEMMFQIVDNLFKGISILVWMIGLGTLFTGTVGVSNIMMVTVRERTMEIGIRRALGARPRDIMWQILSESMVLTIGAGLSGIVAATWLLHAIEKLVVSQGEQGVSFQISFSLAVETVTFIALLGVLAGLAPACRALSVKPIEAIRDE